MCQRVSGVDIPLLNEQETEKFRSQNFLVREGMTEGYRLKKVGTLCSISDLEAVVERRAESRLSRLYQADYEISATTALNLLMRYSLIRLWNSLEVCRDED